MANDDSARPDPQGLPGSMARWTLSEALHGLADMVQELHAEGWAEATDGGEQLHVEVNEILGDVPAVTLDLDGDFVIVINEDQEPIHALRALVEQIDRALCMKRRFLSTCLSGPV